MRRRIAIDGVRYTVTMELGRWSVRSGKRYLGSFVDAAGVSTRETGELGNADATILFRIARKLTEAGPP